MGMHTGVGLLSAALGDVRGGTTVGSFGGRHHDLPLLPLLSLDCLDSCDEGL